jgi:hypothetical protein
MNEVRRYWREYVWQSKVLARAWWSLQQGKADGQAAASLFRLNRLAKNGTGKVEIYQMKSHLIRHFYKKGFCIRAEKSIQELECWHTMRYLSGVDEVCPKCDNTGIFARHELFQFTFLVDGLRYAWHQPMRLVDWPVELSEGKPSVYTGRCADWDLDVVQANWDQAVLWVYLRCLGVRDLPELRTVRGLMRIARFYWVTRKLDIWTRRTRRRIEKRLEGKRGWMAERIREWASDGFPF